MRCSSGMACSGVAEFFPTPWLICATATGPLQWKVGVVCIPTFFFFLCWTLINSHRSFQDAGHRDEGQLRKTEVELYEAVIGIMLRPLFYGTVQPKALLSFGSSWVLLYFFNIFFFLCGESIAISFHSCMKTAWAHFDLFGALTFLLKKRRKKQKNWKHAVRMDSHMSFIACGTARVRLQEIPSGWLYKNWSKNRAKLSPVFGHF